MSQILTRTAPTLQPLDTESLASRIADRIVDAVAAGTLAPGQRLVESEIAAALGVSRRLFSRWLLRPRLPVE